MKALLNKPWVKRLLACLFGGLVLALTVGNQEGTVNGDFGIAFFQALTAAMRAAVAEGRFEAFRRDFAGRQRIG